MQNHSYIFNRNLCLSFIQTVMTFGFQNVQHFKTPWTRYKLKPRIAGSWNLSSLSSLIFHLVFEGPWLMSSLRSYIFSLFRSVSIWMSMILNSSLIGLLASCRICIFTFVPGRLSGIVPAVHCLLAFGFLLTCSIAPCKAWSRARLAAVPRTEANLFLPDASYPEPEIQIMCNNKYNIIMILILSVRFFGWMNRMALSHFQNKPQVFDTIIKRFSKNPWLRDQLIQAGWGKLLALYSGFQNCCLSVMSFGFP